jgi:hypothetical protein
MPVFSSILQDLISPDGLITLPTNQLGRMGDRVSAIAYAALKFPVNILADKSTS